MKTDQQIQNRVMAALKQEPLLEAAEIGVAVHHGVVTLSGNVSNLVKKLVAERAAWQVPEVKAVAQEVLVILPEDDLQTDAAIAEHVVIALAQNTSVLRGSVRVKVADREVMLDGEVDQPYQKEAAFEAIKLIRGIRHIHNRIKLKPLIDTATIKFRITQALLSRADQEASGIVVERAGDKVVLRGNVDSRDEKNVAVLAALSACGDAEVDDQLVIDTR